MATRADLEKMAATFLEQPKRSHQRLIELTDLLLIVDRRAYAEQLDVEVVAKVLASSWYERLRVPFHFDLAEEDLKEAWLAEGAKLIAALVKKRNR